MERVPFGNPLLFARDYLPSPEPTPDDLKTERLLIGVLFAALIIAIGIVTYSGATAISALNE